MCLQTLRLGNTLRAKEIAAQCHSEAGAGVACQEPRESPPLRLVQPFWRKGEGLAGSCLHSIRRPCRLVRGSESGTPKSES